MIKNFLIFKEDEKPSTYLEKAQYLKKPTFTTSIEIFKNTIHIKCMHIFQLHTKITIY